MTLALRTSRRRLLAASIAITATAIGASTRSRAQDEHVDTVSVLAPILPDPAPPDDETGLMPGLELWEARNRAKVVYESAAVENIKPKILLNFSRGFHMHDVMYCAGWAPEIAGHLLPIDSLLGPTARADLPPWSLNSFRWNGKTFGVPIVANPMILFGNRTLLASAGVESLPETWDDLVAAAAALSRTGVAGWTMAGGQSGGLGGLFTHWYLFFLQAGGELFDQDNHPLFANDAGVAGIEMLQRMQPYLDKQAMAHASILDATVAMMQGKAGLMANWAVMHRSFANPAISQISGQLATAPLPRGPVGSASVDSGDGWTIDARTWIPGKAMSLIRYFLEPRIQLHLYAQSGWLPVSLTALADESLAATAPHLNAVRTQMRSRIDSGFRPDFDAVTTVIGNAVRAALAGDVSPIAALRSARDQITRAAR